jgi:predicted RNA binding protein YcfA (HicA-like mRNA interferase family)
VERDSRDSHHKLRKGSFTLIVPHPKKDLRRHGTGDRKKGWL